MLDYNIMLYFSASSTNVYFPLSSSTSNIVFYFITTNILQIIKHINRTFTINNRNFFITNKNFVVNIIRYYSKMHFVFKTHLFLICNNTFRSFNRIELIIEYTFPSYTRARTRSYITGFMITYPNTIFGQAFYPLQSAKVAILPPNPFLKITTHSSHPTTPIKHIRIATIY